MYVYSKRIVQFIEHIKRVVRDILSEELGMLVGNGYFYSKKTSASYPISIVVYNDRSILGYFDSHFREIGFHEKLMHVSKTQLHNIIRHELAHYMTFIRCGNISQPHGLEFKRFCEEFSWDEEVSKASICLETNEESIASEEIDVFRKIQKLMALSASNNKHEAEVAMIKSQQLLLKYNLEESCVGLDIEERFVLKRILKQKKRDAKMRAIATILNTFFVSCVFHRVEEYTYLEILGSAVNVQIAEYVANVLLIQLDVLWDAAKKEHGLKGAIAKNSFFLGIAKGYFDKIRLSQKVAQNAQSQALVIIEKKLTEAKNMAYRRLTSARTSGGYCPESSELGKKAGHALNINPALNSRATNSKKLIS